MSKPIGVRPFRGYFFFLATMAIFVLSAAVQAQTPDTATVHIHVTDESNGSMGGVSVVITSSQTGLRRTAQTDQNGNVTFAGLPVSGTYDFEASKENFAPAQLNDVTLRGGTTASLSLALSIGASSSKVVVTGTVGEVRSDEPQLGDRLGSGQMEEVPLINRRITFLPLLNAANRPAINQGDVFMNEALFTTNGTGRRQTWFEIDGSNGVDAWGRQTIFTNVPVDSVQEMTILTNAFSAEYGLTAGSVVNIITKSGTKTFHGSLTGLWRPSDTEASLSGFTSTTATSGNDLVNDTLRQSSAALSGPINHDTQFFANGEYSWENRASPVISPIAPGKFVGKYRGWLLFGRIDHEFSENNKMYFRSDVDDFTDTNPNGVVGGNNLPSVDRVFRRRTFSEELGETAVLNPLFVNNARLQFQLASPITQFAPVVYGTQFSVPISTGGTFTSGTSQSALLMNRQYEANDTLSVAKERHDVRFGGGVIRAHSGGDSKEFGGPIYLGMFSYNACTAALSVCESPTFLNNIANVKSYTQSYGNANYSVDDVLWSAFVQDDFRFRPNLTLNLGLRYEKQTFTDSTKDFAPRAGFAYSVHGDGKTVVRGGFGIYYSQIVDNSEANYTLAGPTGVFNYTAAPGQIGFPMSVAAAPLTNFPAGATLPLRTLYIRPGESAYLNQFFPTSPLIDYPSALLSPYTEQWTVGVAHQLMPSWVLSLDYLGSHTIKINRPLDVNPPSPFVRTAPGQIRSAQAANCMRPYWIWWYKQQGTVCNPSLATNPQPPYSVIQSDVNDGFSNYHALDVNLTRSFSNGVSLLASYTWSHTIDNVDPDTPNQNPNDANFTGSQEKASAIFDERNRFVLSGFCIAPFKFRLGGIATLESSLPYNVTTGTANSGDLGVTTDRPVVNGVVIGRNAGRGRPIYTLDLFLERPIPLGERIRLDLRIEGFNVFNHNNFVGYSGTWGNAATAGAGFGQPLAGITNQLPARELQFLAKLAF